MTRCEKAARIQEVLDRLYPAPAIPLRHADPFTLLVSVVLSAQTTDARVNLVTPALFARARTPAAMARLSEDEILRHIRSCGLAPAKAKALRALSARLVAEHGGHVPADFAALEALPGVGHKTASVVMVQAFGVPAFPVDTHIHRLAARWGLSSGQSVAQTERDLKKLFPEEDWGKVHLQLIYFGREHCPARGHAPAGCAICAWAAPRRRQPAERTTAATPRQRRAADVRGASGRRARGAPRPPARREGARGESSLEGGDRGGAPRAASALGLPGTPTAERRRRPRPR